MAPLIDVTKYPDALKAMYGLERVARERGIDGRCCIRLLNVRPTSASGEWNTSGVPWHMRYFKSNYAALQRGQQALGSAQGVPSRRVHSPVTGR